MSGRRVNLTPQLMTFVDTQVQNGRHRDPSEVVGEALRRYESELAAEAEQIKAIRAVSQDGREAIARGDFVMVATSEDNENLLNRLARQGPGLVVGGGID